MIVKEMTWEEYEENIKKSVVILPIGSLEQHGPHLPLNVDVIIAEEFAVYVADKLGCMVLPPITYGYKSYPTSGGGQLFPGTTSLNGKTFMDLVLEILKETYRHGGRKFLIINAHYENEAFINEAVDIFTNDCNDAKVITLAWWDQVSQDVIDDLFAEAGFPGWDTEHASIAETSLMLYFSNDLVRKDKIISDQAKRKPTYGIFPPPKDIIPQSGVLYKAAYATQQKGERLANHVIDKIVMIVKRELL